MAFGRWVLAHGCADSVIGVWMFAVFPAAFFTAFREFHTINFLDEFIQGNGKCGSAFNALFLADCEHKITSFSDMFGAGHTLNCKECGKDTKHR